MQSSLLEVGNYDSATFPEPREFQALAHEKLRDGVRAGHRCQMLMAATGSGKTFLGMRVIHEALKRGKRALFVCDRSTLIEQTSKVADSYGLGAHGVIQANHWRTNSDFPFQIASIQTLARRRWPASDVTVVDEAHTLYKAMTDHLLEGHERVIGLSATPFAKGLGKYYTNLINAATMHDLTQSGVLVPMRIFSCTRPNMLGAETSGGEWTDKAAETRGLEIIGDVVKEWCKLAADRKTIVFGATIRHCEELCRQFNDAGVLAQLFTSETTPPEREQLLAEYGKPDSAIRVLISVEALAKGFDVRDVGCVADCRPLRKSLSTAIQMWGRGLRSSPETGKIDCLLLDFSGNIQRFAEDFERVYYNGLETLDAGEKLDLEIRREEEDKFERPCPSCGFRPFRRRCMACGHEAQSASLIEHEAGEMREIRIGKAKAADDPRHLYEQACTYAKSHGNPDTARGRAAHLYREIAGDWPSRSWDFGSMPNVPLTRPVMNKITSLRIAFARRPASASA